MREYHTLISAEETKHLLGHENLVIVDCRYNLFDHSKGQQDYQKDHIPGAVYAHLKHDLAGPVISGKTSRHPLPDIDTFSDKLSTWGINETIQVIAYDDNNSAMAVRLWWLLKWLGHDKVALLDGGYDHWKNQNYPTSSTIPVPNKRTFSPKPRTEMVVTSQQVESIIEQNSKIIIDSRAEERYRGEIEPIDPVAGHIPGALNRFYGHNVDETGNFKPAAEIEEVFKSLIADTPAENVIFYCGSGVTGAHNVFAYYHSGLGLPKLYGGSWSEWITNPDRPIITKETE